MVKEKDLKIAKKISRELKEKLGDELISVILYGSRAHGTAKKDSDMDLFVLTTQEPGFLKKDYSKIINTTTKYWLKEDIYISPIVYGLKEFREREKNELVFIQEVKKGIKIL